MGINWSRILTRTFTKAARTRSHKRAAQFSRGKHGSAADNSFARQLGRVYRVTVGLVYVGVLVLVGYCLVEGARLFG